MHTYSWKKEYEVGWEEIDEQHKVFLNIMNKVILNQTAEPHILNLLVDEIYNFAIFHFGSEQNTMTLTDYPNISSQMEEHRLLIEQLEEKNTLFKKSEIELQGIVVFMAKWFVTHTTKDDRELGKWLNANVKH